jgi:diguanylate cyclase (GGDEF)-like protein
MHFSLRKSGASATLFGVLVLVTLVLNRPQAQATGDLTAVPGVLIYLLALTGLTASGMFRRSREFSMFLLILGCYAGLRFYNWAPDASPAQQELSLGLIALLLPINVFIGDVLRERGIVSGHGTLRILIIGFQVSAIVLVLQVAPQSLLQALRASFTDAPWVTRTQLPQIAVFSAAVTTGWLVFRCFRQPSSLQNGLLFGFLATMIGLNQHAYPSVAGTWFVMAELILLAAGVIHTHNVAFFDDLTGMPTRRSLKQHVAQLGKRYTIAMLDIDHFKKINDSHGHDAGDQVLRMIAAEIRRLAAGRGYRYSGGAFALVFPSKDGAETTVLMETLRQRIADRPFIIRSLVRPRRKPINPRQTTKLRRILITVSIGVAEKQPQHADSLDVLRAADRALFRAKQAGRDQVAQ